MISSRVFWALLLSASCVAPSVWAQGPTTAQLPGSVADRIVSAAELGHGVWIPEQIATMNRLRDGALRDLYAYKQLSYLTDNIGPRLSGSIQANTEVEWVAAQMRALGAEVSLERTAVPHWVRGEESAALIDWPNKVPGSTQKIVLCALGTQ